MINLPAVYVANALGIMLLLTTLFCNLSLFRTKRKDIRYLLYIIIAGILGCIADPLVFSVDGVPGKAAHWINVLGNTYLFLTDTWLGVLWLSFLQVHMKADGHKSKQMIRVLCIFPAFLTMLTIANLVYPIMFVVGEDNVYVRLQMSLIFWAYLLVYLILSVALYLIYRKNSPGARYFPVGVFIWPILAGAIIQVTHYGLSMTWPSIAVAAAGALMCVRTEGAYVDSLTGIYNREYLYQNKVYQKMGGVIMLDVNRFKLINEEFGHDEGDRALMKIAAVIAAACDRDGIAIRYSGDEFLVFTRSGEPEVLERICAEVKEGLERATRMVKKPYDLSVSYSYAAIDSTQSIDEVIRAVDRKMYEAKKAYYMMHDDRRHY